MLLLRKRYLIVKENTIRAFVPSFFHAFAPSRLHAFAPSRLRAFKSLQQFH